MVLEPKTNWEKTPWFLSWFKNKNGPIPPGKNWPPENSLMGMDLWEPWKKFGLKMFSVFGWVPIPLKFPTWFLNPNWLPNRKVGPKDRETETVTLVVRVNQFKYNKFGMISTDIYRRWSPDIVCFHSSPLAKCELSRVLLIMLKLP